MMELYSKKMNPKPRNLTNISQYNQILLKGRVCEISKFRKKLNFLFEREILYIKMFDISDIH